MITSWLVAAAVLGGVSYLVLVASTILAYVENIRRDRSEGVSDNG